MKQIRLLSIFIYLFAVLAANAGDESPGKGKGAAASAPATTPTNLENIAILKGLIVTGALTKVIGSFNTFGRPSAGNTFEIDLTILPKEKIQFTRNPADPSAHAGPHPSYIPFLAPLIIEEVLRRPGTKDDHAVINLSARHASGKFLIQVLAESLEKGSKVRILFYQDVGFIGSMAEAEGVLK